eukprot:CAMPEP_0175107050 /NCGR_PEP_ID=MMETSP0086_2-20121207/11624_1 /TAXON_ID=136419 /ORGANISM="Unknown Unknown, Strain D1" /LENGTH=35 /DNA_ID= /DNA_START= /DNA_END= /DNA_ORIENTATION=
MARAGTMGVFAVVVRVFGVVVVVLGMARVVGVVGV